MQTGTEKQFTIYGMVVEQTETKMPIASFSFVRNDVTLLRKHKLYELTFQSIQWCRECLFDRRHYFDV